MTDSYVWRLLPLTCLALDIVEAILDGRQPKGLRLSEMLGSGWLDWNEQRVKWGFSSCPMPVLGEALDCNHPLLRFRPRRSCSG